MPLYYFYLRKGGVTLAQKKDNVRTAAEMSEWQRNYQIAEDAIKKLRDVTKTTHKTTTAYNKDQVISYLQNIGSNEKSLMKLSRYLYYRSQIYFRIIDFYSSMFELDIRTVIPKSNDGGMTIDMDGYNETIKWLDAMKLSRHMKAPLTTVFKEDVFFGAYWLDESGMVVIELDPDYARIDCVYPYGNFGFSMDMSWFRSRQDILGYWGSPFTEMYEEYKDTGEKWQHLTERHAMCFKFHSETPDLITPPFIGIFLSLISLEDLQDLQAVQDEMNTYRLLGLKLKPLSSSKMADDWEVSPDLMVKYFDKMLADALPPYTTAAIIPGSDDVQVVNFSDDATTDVDKLSNAMKAILDTSGGGEILQGSNINSTAAFKAAQIANTNFALSPILPQIEGWVEMALNVILNDPAKVKFPKVSSYTKDSYREEILKNCQNGLPQKLTLASISGFSEHDTMALNTLERELNIPEVFRPLNTSYTQSGSGSDESEAGRPETPDDELSPSGERTRNE